jgi:hypothetical protein
MQAVTLDRISVVQCDLAEADADVLVVRRFSRRVASGPAS